MEYLHSLFDEQLNDATAVTVGKFDGMHKGHELLCELISRQKANGLKSCIVTFENSPRFAFTDEIGSLITPEERRFLLEQKGIDYLVEAPFDDRMCSTPPEEFVSYLCKNLNMKYMCVGSDFRFGYKGAGDVVMLDNLSKKYGFELEIIDKIQLQERDISSTFIREELKEGNISLVNNLLGYNYFVWGKVVHGAHLGHKIGIPTINIIPPKDKLIPKFGVYVTELLYEGKKYYGVTNVGCKPTVDSSKRAGIEMHILNFDRDIYDENVKITFLEFLRPEVKFDSLEDLKNQMNSDKQKAVAFFNNK